MRLKDTLEEIWLGVKTVLILAGAGVAGFGFVLLAIEVSKQF